MINKIVFIDTIIVMLRIVTDNLSKVRSPNEPSLKLCDKSTHEVSTLISFYRRHHHDHLLHKVSTLVTTTISIITINTQALFCHPSPPPSFMPGTLHQSSLPSTECLQAPLSLLVLQNSSFYLSHCTAGPHLTAKEPDKPIF